MTSSRQGPTVYECDSCGDYQLDPGLSVCCGVEVSECSNTVPVEPPDEEQIMGTIFDISETELEVCRCLMSKSEVTINELADAIDRDRSVVSRHLNHLVELGMVEKQSRILPEGGRANVYRHRSADVIRQRFTLGLYLWMADAVELIDSFSEEKIARMVQRGGPTEPDYDQIVLDPETDSERS